MESQHRGREDRRPAPASPTTHAVDATYGWNYGPTKDFMAVSRDGSGDLALGQEMEGS